MPENSGPPLINIAPTNQEQVKQKVTCGLFGISDDYTEKFQSLDAHFVQNKASTFFFEASSNSMEPLIFDKDILVIDRSLKPSQGGVCVLSLDGEMICKRVYFKRKGLLLRSENPAYKDFIVTPEMNLILFGPVKAIARNLL